MSAGEGEIIHVVVEDLKREYGNWHKLRSSIQSYGRNDEPKSIQTAHCNLLVKDPTIGTVEQDAFYECSNLVSVDLPYVTSISTASFFDCRNLLTCSLPNAVSLGFYAFFYCIKLTVAKIPRARTCGEWAFGYCYSLRDVLISSDIFVRVNPRCFMVCIGLEVLSKAAEFDVDTGERYVDRVDPSNGIVSYLRWRNEQDERDVLVRTIWRMLKLCGINRASAIDAVMCFMVENEDVATNIIDFLSGRKRGRGDLRGASKEKLKSIAGEIGVLRQGENKWNEKWGGVRV